MKEIIIKDGISYEGQVITGDDISMPSPFSNKTLTQVLTEQEEEVEKLKRNVKYLTKYGGVGGGGSGGGGGSVKTKFAGTITYTNLNGVVFTENIKSGSFFALQTGKEVTITVVLTSTATLNTYNFSVTVGSNTISKSFSGAGKTASITFTPESNSSCTIQVSGETTSSVNCSLFLNTNSFIAAVYRGELPYVNDQEIYNSAINELVYRIKLDNYLPDTITDDYLVGFKINDDEYLISDGRIDFKGDIYEVVVSIDSETNTKTTLLEITDCSKIFSEFGIYKLTAIYHFNNNELTQEINYIYKSEKAFVYCHSNTSTPTLYQEPQTDPVYSYGYTENFLYKVYGRSGLDASQTYSLYYTIFKEGDSNTEYSLGVYYDEEEPETPISEVVGTKYFATYKISNGKILVTGESNSGNSTTFYKVTITRNSSGSLYTKTIESYFQPTNPASVNVDYSIGFSNSYLSSDFIYNPLPIGSPFKDGVLYYINTGTALNPVYVLVKERTPKPGVQYYYVTPKLITVTFYITDPQDSSYNNTVVYYVYVGKTQDLEYIFTNDSGALFYGAKHANTVDAVNEIMDFPWEDGKYKLTENSKTFKFKSASAAEPNTIYFPLSSTSAGPSVLELVSGNSEFPFGTLATPGTIDAMFSFGLKYYSDNYELPVLKINFNSGTSVTLYKNRIEYVTGSAAPVSYTRFVFPSDDNYHLISFYFKYRYTFEGDSEASALNSNPALMILIDGVIELAPIELNSSTSITYNSTSITYYKGQWDYNYIGAMVMNGKPSALDASASSSWPGVKLIRRYYYDFDIVIPSNYYQTYREFLNIQGDSQIVYTDTFDSSIYSTLGDKSNWTNYYSYGLGDHINKFIKVNNLSALANLTDLPIYVVELEATGEDVLINEFLRNTLTSYQESEADTVPNCSCRLQKLTKAGDTYTPISLFNDVSFTITYQGSSTLLYGAKNFYIESKAVNDGDSTFRDYWTPDRNLFKPELGFNLKCDMVDSSHSNNVIIGDFVHEYFDDSDNPGFGSKSNGIRSCLTGSPIILVMTDSRTESSEVPYIYLGIYNINLTRSSVMNLGYQKINTEHPECERLSSNVDDADIYRVRSGSGVISFPNNYVIAEVQGNSKTLYDYSQYDRGLLKYMFGDFFIYEGSESRSYSNSIEKAFKGLNKLVYSDILKHNYYNSLQLSNFKTISGTFYYYDESGTLVSLSPAQKSRCISENDVDNLLTYSDYHLDPDTQKKIAVVGNARYQFHLLLDSNGNRAQYSRDYYYYVEELQSITEWDHTVDDKFHYVNALKYYLVCMAFAMVDSVQKNLTIKCRNFRSNGANTWYLGFYDMDTAFGVNNAGDPVDFKAFSDYIDATGEIIQNYCPSDASIEENIDGSLFDTPSSFLFLFAKYGNILHTNPDNPIVDSGYESTVCNPLAYWMKLRDTGGYFETAKKFCERFVDGYFGNINPLLWNLNYMYKYFSETNNTSALDTELSKFNGTMRYRRSYWLDNRFKILDVLFGIKNDDLIGTSSFTYSAGVSSTVSNPDVEINQTMFSGFTKGYPSPVSFSFSVSGPPRTPIVFQTATDKYRLYIIDTTGSTETITSSISSSTDCGFYGTQKITALNEFGQFLLNTTNKIENNKIEEIIINKGTSTGNNNLEIDLSLVRSIKRIQIDVSSNSAKKFSNISIIVPSGSSSSFTLDSVILKGLTANNLSISCNDADKDLTINSLVIQDCVLGNLQMDKVIISGSNTFTNNRIGQYTLSGAFKNISINDSDCTNFTLSSSTSITLTGTFPKITDLSLSDNITSVTIYNGTSTSANNKTLANCSLRNLNCSGLTIRGAKFSELTIELSDNVTTLKPLNLMYCSSLRTLNISGKNLGNIHYNTYAMYSTGIQNYNIKKGSSTSYVDLASSSMNIYYNGNNIFAWNSSHPKQYMIPLDSGNAGLNFYIESADAFNNFTRRNYSTSTHNNNLSIQDVSSLFRKVQFSVSSGTSLNLTGMWYGSYFSTGVDPLRNNNPIPSSVDITASDTYTIPASYSTFITSFRQFISNASAKGVTIGNISNMFTWSNFSIVTKEFFDLLPSAAKTNYTDVFGQKVFSGTRESTTFKIFIESGLLGNFNTIKLGTEDDTNSYRLSQAVFFNRVDSEDMPSPDGMKMEILTEPGFIDAFGNNPVTKTITNLGFYTSSTVSFDCSDGFPSSITTISDFGSRSQAGHMTNMSHMFDRVPKTCKVNLDRFFRSSTESWTVEPNGEGNCREYLELYEFFINPDTEEFKFTPVYTYKATATAVAGSYDYRTDGTLGFLHPKTILSSDVNRLLEKFKYGDSVGYKPTDTCSTLASIFSNCDVIESDGIDTFSKMVQNYNINIENEYYSLIDTVEGISGRSLATGNYYILDGDLYKKVEVFRKRDESTDPWTYYYITEGGDEVELQPGDLYGKDYSNPKILDIDGLFRNFHFYTNTSKSSEIPLDTEILFNDSNNDSITSLARAFYSDHIYKLKNKFNLSANCLSMYETFYNCTYDFSNYEVTPGKFWATCYGGSGETIKNYPCIDVNGEFPLIPDNFFDICRNASATRCFGASGFNLDGLSGQLYSASSTVNPWWTGSGKLKDFTGIIQNCRIFPILPRNSESYDFYIFPTWYMNSIYQCNVFIPLFTTDITSEFQDRLFIFESVPASGSGYGGKLPNVPPLSSSTYIRTAFSQYIITGSIEYSIYLTNSDETGRMSFTVNTGSSYKGIIPLALADILHLNSDTLIVNSNSSNKVNFSSSTNHPIVSVSDGSLYQSVVYNAPRFAFRYWNAGDVNTAADGVREYVTM